MSKKRAAPQSRGKATSGGGIRGNKVRQVGYRSGPPRTEVISPSGVADLGASINYPRQPLVKGTAPQVRSGNDVAASTVCGPGGSRTIYKFGTEGVHGKVSQGEGKAFEGGADRGERAILGPAPKGKSVA
jgi:hypothetical protein